MAKRKIASLEIWNDKFYMIPALSFLDSVVNQHKRLDFSRYQQFRLIVGELLKARIENAYPNKKGNIYFELFLSEEEFEVSVRDKGVPGWQDFSYDIEKIATSKSDRRNYLINQFADGIGIEKLGKDGQRICAKMRILNPIEFKEPEPYEEEEALDENITIRQVTTEADVVEAIRCIYSEYGYSYSYEGLYYVDTFMKKIENREIMSFLAVNDHGQTAGHFALSFSKMCENMPEISTVVIRRPFRKLGLFAKFMDYCIEVGSRQNVRAIMGQPVGFHPMSQKAALRAGFTATSLLMAHIDSNVESEYNVQNKRLDLTVAVRIFDDEACSKAYPPTELRALTGKIYDRLGWKYDLRDEYKLSSNTEMKVDHNERLGTTCIVLREAADDAESVLREAVNSSIRKKSEMIELAIVLNSPSCNYGYEIAKKCGFVLSGLIPGGENGDYLMMQMRPGDQIEYDRLVLVGEFEELKDEIVALNQD